LAATVYGNGTDDVTVRAHNKKPDYRLLISKTDAVTGTAMSGVSFVISGTNGTAYSAVAATDALGIAVIDFPQANGTYTVTETPPTGYRAVAPYTIRTVDGEMYISGGPDNLQNIVILAGGYVFSKNADGYTMQTGEQIAANNLYIVDDAIIARAVIGISVKNHLLTASDRRHRHPLPRLHPENCLILTLIKRPIRSA
jgi:hypothetical protein